MKIAFGLDVGGTAVKYGIISQKGEILFSENKDFLSKSIQDVRSGLNQSIQIMRKAAGQKPIGIGLGLPGCVDRENQTVPAGADNLACLNGMPINAILDPVEENLCIDNDAKCAALGEKIYGAAKKYSHAAVITLGTGIGCGLILDNALYRGANNYAGEYGHIPLIPDGLQCECGKRGCFEMYVSAKAIVRRAHAFITRAIPTSLIEEPRITSNAVFEHAKNGDKIADMIIREMSRYLALGLSHVINTFNPEAIIIGGGLSYFFDLYIDNVIYYLEDYALPYAFKNVEILRAELKNEAGWVGAAAMVFQSEKE